VSARRYDLLSPIGLRNGARVDERTGFLHAPVRPTRTGIMLYRMADGSISRELKHPEDVFDPASLATLERVVATRGHPRDSKGRPVDVTTDTVDRLKVGHAGDKIERQRVRDEDHPVVAMTITDAPTVKAIVEDGLDQVSMGYTVEIVDEPGVWNGQAYDRRHKNIRYDHIAVALPMGGRGGSTVNVVLDEADAELVLDGEPMPSSPPQRKDDDTMATIRITLDSIGFDIDPAAWSVLQPLIAKRDAALEQFKTDAAAHAKALEKLEGERDAAKADAAKEKKRADDAEAKASSPVSVKPLLTTLAAARKLVQLDEKAVDAILADKEPIARTHREVVLAVCKDEAESLKDKSAAYFEARFDALVASVKRTDATAPVAGALFTAAPAPDVDAKKLDEVLYPEGDPLAYLDEAGITGQPKLPNARA
jgi:uncharacterized protein